jgi:hypothetical protein
MTELSRASRRSDYAVPAVAGRVASHVSPLSAPAYLHPEPIADVCGKGRVHDFTPLEQKQLLNFWLIYSPELKALHEEYAADKAAGFRGTIETWTPQSGRNLSAKDKLILLGPPAKARFYSRASLNGVYFRTLTRDGKRQSSNAGIRVKFADEGKRREGHWSFGKIENIFTHQPHLATSDLSILLKVKWFVPAAPAERGGIPHVKTTVGHVYHRDPFVFLKSVHPTNVIFLPTAGNEFAVIDFAKRFA